MEPGAAEVRDADPAFDEDQVDEGRTREVELHPPPERVVRTVVILARVEVFDEHALDGGPHFLLLTVLVR